jgi:hypothetical protein
MECFKTVPDGLQLGSRLDLLDTQTKSNLQHQHCRLNGLRKNDTREVLKGVYLLHDCNSSAAKLFKPPPCSVSYISATQVLEQQLKQNKKRDAI